MASATTSSSETPAGAKAPETAPFEEHPPSWGLSTRLGSITAAEQPPTPGADTPPLLGAQLLLMQPSYSDSVVEEPTHSPIQLQPPQRCFGGSLLRQPSWATAEGGGAMQLDRQQHKQPLPCSTHHPSQKQQQQLHTHHWSAASQAAAVVVACMGWVLVSSAAILINKKIMVDLSFHFPAAVAALGMAGTTLTAFIACRVLHVVPCKATVSPYFFFTRIMTTGFCMALSFQAGNTAYLYLSVAFVQMLKAFTPVSTMLCGFGFGLEKPSARLIAAVACICAGVVAASYGEVNFSTFGLLAMLVSIAAEGLRTCMMQQLLTTKAFHPLEAWMYLGPATTLWLLLIIGVFEAQAMRDQHALTAVAAAHGWHFGFAALAGAAVNALAMVVIQLGSALTLKVLGICKDIGLVGLGVALLGEHVGSLQVLGYCISLVGFGYYNWVKLAAMGLPEPSTAAGDASSGCSSPAKLAVPLLSAYHKLGCDGDSWRNSSSSSSSLIGTAPACGRGHTGSQSVLIHVLVPSGGVKNL